MPNCTTQQAEYDLAVATEAVRLAQWAVEQAEATLANMLYSAAVSDRMAKYMALQTCLMGGMSPMMTMAQAPEDSVIVQQRLHVQRLGEAHLHLVQEVRKRHDLLDQHL